ncbi:monovalent cation/H(+) antiporter subunit G [Roseovarius sp. LXJ103]|uniref:cation:proton antiporter n=1 Tax=Roseovarius carneus TaxID=2853164 RepID=UPI000D61C550|nr:monovalent cation/H(+) antiporter subunit G [Roseovarius carneus]MBZ8119168.1 monovalent cation/H(+) antiporter subunit G [Roseovarius carneus]PWE35200.1 pesticidal protein Cry5Ba [Pelagicola sp. LXJ1103]
MSWDIIGIYATSAALIIGAIFAMVGAIGLIKFNDPMVRMHAPTKVGTVGIGALLAAAIIYNSVIGDGAIHAILIMAFLFVTAPISANFIAKVNIHRRNCDTLPAPEGDETWSTLNVSEADRAIAPQKDGAA